MVTGTTTGELFPAADSNDGVLLLDAAAVDARDCCNDASPSRWLAAVWVRNGAANGNKEENDDAPLRAPSYAEPKIEGFSVEELKREFDGLTWDIEIISIDTIAKWTRQFAA